MDVNSDVVNHPSHYTDGRFEVIDFIECYGLGFHLGNAVKYISRAGKKDPAKEIEDLRKAIWYIERAINSSKVNTIRTTSINDSRSMIPFGDYCVDKKLSHELTEALRDIVTAQSRWVCNHAIWCIQQHILKKENNVNEE